jgi:hypothetical protein
MQTIISHEREPFAVELLSRYDGVLLKYYLIYGLGFR